MVNVNLVLFKKSGSRKIFPLPSSVTVIGRRHDCDLRIPIMSVSKRHCQLNYNKGVLKIRDLGSRNGTRLNNKPIDEAAIQAGDSVEIGPLTFVFQIDGQPKNPVLPDFAAQNLSSQDTPARDMTDEDFEEFTELDNLDSLEDNS